MKNISKIFSVVLSLIMFSFVIVGCSNSGDNNSDSSAEQGTTSEATSTSVSVSSVENTSSEPSEVSYEISSESEIVDGSSSEASGSSKPGIDPAVEERSYSEDEAWEYQSTKKMFYKYRPATNSYYYKGYEDSVTIPPEFKICPIFPEDGSSSVKEIIVPETVEVIPYGAFIGALNLEKLVILNPDCIIGEEDQLGDTFILPKTSDSGDGFDVKYKSVEVYMYFKNDGEETPVKKHFDNHINDNPWGAYDKSCLHDLATESYK